MVSTKLIKSVSFVITAVAMMLSSQANAVSQGDWLMRFGAVSVNPNDSSGQVGAIAGSSVSVSSSQGIFLI